MIKFYLITCATDDDYYSYFTLNRPQKCSHESVVTFEYNNIYEAIDTIICDYSPKRIENMFEFILQLIKDND